MAGFDIHYGFWVLVLDWMIRVGALFWIPAHTPSASARSWLLLVGFVPLLGLPIYLVLGHPWLSRQRRRRQLEASQAIRAAQVQHDGPRTRAALPIASPGVPGAGIAALVQQMGAFAPVPGNSVVLMDRYDVSLRQLVDDIDAATEQVHLLYYLMFDDAVGEAVAQALQRAAARGVTCRLLLDALGAKRGLKAFSGALRAAGVDVQAMMPNLLLRRSARLDLRNHRKIAVIDHHIGHVGSQNLAMPGFIAAYPNREVVARVHGQAVAQLAALFASDWYIETGHVLAIAMPTGHAGRAGDADPGDVLAQVLPSGPAYPFENARNTVVALIHRARTRVVLATPYFVPDDATLAALSIAALSGVDVQLILSRSNNQRLTAWAQAAYYDALLAAGVRIALYGPHFLHAKHLSVDDDIALVGSINLDIRSFALNAEVGLVCYDGGVVARLRAIEADYLAQCDHVDAATWGRRRVGTRSLEGLARLADALL